MKCEKCGCNLNNGDVVCKTCGAEVSMTSLEKTQVQNQSIYGLNLSIIAWVAMLVFSIVNFRFGDYSYFNVNVNWRPYLLCAPVLLIGTFIAIYKNKLSLILIPLVLYPILLILNRIIVMRVRASQGNAMSFFSLWFFIYLTLLAIVIISFFICSKKLENMKPLTIISIACAVVYCFISVVVYDYHIFYDIFSSWNLWDLSFFAGTALLGLQKT